MQKGSTDLVMQVSEYFNSISNKVESKYGIFILNRTGVKSSISAPIHLGDEDYYFAAVINVEKEKNSFYLHEVALKNKKDTLPFKTEPRHESGLLSDNVSIYSLLNKLQNVNNDDTKFPLDVNFSYNELIKKTLYKKSYALIGIAKNNNNEPYVVSFIVNKHTNEIKSIDVLYAVNAKKK